MEEREHVTADTGARQVSGTIQSWGGLIRHLDSRDWFSPAEEEGELEEEVSTLIPSPTRSHTPLHHPPSPHLLQASAAWRQLLGNLFRKGTLVKRM